MRAKRVPPDRRVGCYRIEPGLSNKSSKIPCSLSTHFYRGPQRVLGKAKGSRVRTQRGRLGFSSPCYVTSPVPSAYTSPRSWRCDTYALLFKRFYVCAPGASLEKVLANRVSFDVIGLTKDLNDGNNRVSGNMVFG